MAAADKEITYTAADVAILEETILKRKLEHMNEVFANAQRAQYGQSSEKKTYVLNEDQLNFFNEAEDCQNHKAEGPTEETLTVKAHARKKKRTVDELEKNLPVEEIVIDLPESRLTCDKCGGTFKLIGKKLVRRENSLLFLSLRRFWNTIVAPMPVTNVRKTLDLLISLPPRHRLLL